MKHPVKKRNKRPAWRPAVKLNKMLPVYTVHQLGSVNPLFRLAYFTEFQKPVPLALN